MSSIGERLRTARKRLDWSQTRLSAESGVRQQTIGSLESGNNQRTGFMVDLAKALKVRPEWLHDGELPMEVVKGEPPLLNEAILEAVITAIEESIAERGISIEPPRKAILISTAYQSVLRTKPPDASNVPAVVHSLLRLVT